MTAPNDLEDLLGALDPDTRTLVSEADLGRQVPEFLRSELGRYLIGCAAQEHFDSMLQLETVAWWRRRKIQELQNRAWRARSFLSWLRSLILSGRSAENALLERED